MGTRHELDQNAVIARRLERLVSTYPKDFHKWSNEEQDYYWQGRSDFIADVPLADAPKAHFALSRAWVVGWEGARDHEKLVKDIYKKERKRRRKHQRVT